MTSTPYLINLDFLFNNPFRVLGVPVTATTREIESSIVRAKALESIGKKIEFPTDLALAVEADRSSESLDDAKSKIEQSSGRAKHSIFWFWEGNSVDEMALSALRKGDLIRAGDLWSKMVKAEISESNFSCVRNLSLLRLCQSVTKGSIKKKNLEESLLLSGKFLSSSYFISFVEKTTAGGNVDSSALKSDFARKIYNALVRQLKKNEFSAKEILDYFNEFPSSIQEDLKEQFAAKPIQEIENAIAKAKEALEETPHFGDDIASFLISETKENLAFLIGALHEDNLDLEGVRANLGLAVLNSSMSYFSYMRENEPDEDPGSICLELSREAYNICKLGGAGRRIGEALEKIKEWVADKPQRDLYRKVGEHIEFITGKLDNLPDTWEIERYPEAAADLLHSCKSRLKKMKALMGSGDEHYCNIRDAVAGNVSSLCIEFLNETDDQEEMVLPILRKLGDLEMSKKLRKGYDKNLAVINENIKQKKITKALEAPMHFIGKKMQKIPRSPGARGAEFAFELLHACYPKLNDIKRIIGSQAPGYLQASSAVAAQVMNMCVSYANNGATDRASWHSCLKESLNILKSVDGLDMDVKTRNSYRENIRQVQNLIEQSKGGWDRLKDFFG